MTAKIPVHPVDFYATSQRLVHACKRAAKHNKGLARDARFHELATTLIHATGHHHSERVVLSHAEDHVVLTGARGHVVATGFHLLFTEPTTHPAQVAQWMRATNVRAEERLHVVKVNDIDAKQVSDLLRRVCSAFQGHDRDHIIDASLAGDTLLVRSKHRMLRVPLDDISALKGRPRTDIEEFTIDPDGSFIYWPALDVHLGWEQFLQIVDPDELQRAQQRSAAFNRRYGAAIRKLREEAAIRQSGVPGLTDRQVRRIEQGECRATTSALKALAAAHGLDVNAYMSMLAKAMSFVPKRG